MSDDSSHGTWTVVETIKLGAATSVVVITCCWQVIPGLSGSLFDFELGFWVCKVCTHICQAETARVAWSESNYCLASTSPQAPPQSGTMQEKFCGLISHCLFLSFPCVLGQWWCSCWLEAWILQSQPGHSSNSGRRERLHPPCIDLADINTPTQNVANS